VTEARGKEHDVAVIKNGEHQISMIGPVPDKSLLFEAPEFLAALCQVTRERVQILTFRDLWLWTGEFIEMGEFSG